MADISDHPSIHSCVSQTTSTAAYADLISSAAFDDDPVCYICTGTTHIVDESALAPLELIAPCACRSYVHRQCLDLWRIRAWSDHALTHCPTCQQPFEFLPSAENSLHSVRSSLSTSPAVHHTVQREKWRRVVLTLVVVVVGSFVAWGIDVGLPAVVQHDGPLLHAEFFHEIGLSSVPRIVAYVLLSFVVTACVSGCLVVVAWCRAGCRRADCTIVGCGVANCWLGFELETEGAMVTVVLAILAFAIVGVVVMIVALVGGMGSAMDQHGKHRIRRAQVLLLQVKNLRPLVAV